MGKNTYSLVSQAAWYVLNLVEALLAFRFVMKLLEANPTAAFTRLIYLTSDIIVAPFEAVFRTVRFEGKVLEWTTILAMVVYWIIAWIIINLFSLNQADQTGPSDGEISSGSV